MPTEPGEEAWRLLEQQRKGEEKQTMGMAEDRAGKGWWQGCCRGPEGHGLADEGFEGRGIGQPVPTDPMLPADQPFAPG